MDIEQIRQLIDLMVENELTQLEIRDGENRVSLRRPRGWPCPRRLRRRSQRQ
jgi:hypothetical protein